LRIFILLNKGQDDYSSLPNEANKVFVFEHVGAPSYDAVEEALNKLEVLFHSAQESDRIIFNGPSWLIAIAGFVWMNTTRNRLGILAYDNHKKQYVELDNGY
jgi:hypothetical protein